MHSLVRTVFSKLYMLDPTTEEAKLLTKSDDDAQELELKMTVQSKEISENEQESSEDRHSIEKTESSQDAKPTVPYVQRVECTHAAIIQR